MLTVLFQFTVLSLSVVPALNAVEVADLHKRVAKFNSGVKGKTKFGGPGTPYWGEVVRIDVTSLTLRHQRDPAEAVIDLDIHPVDVLATGVLRKSAVGAFSYRWEGVKKGDTIQVHAIIDKDDGVEYCTEVCITRRPGGKLPQGQRPRDDHRYLKASVLNDLDNGEEVSDDDISQAFPLKYDSGTKEVRDPGGLPKEYRAKLDAIRAKKAKENDTKATPPEKK